MEFFDAQIVLLDVLLYSINSHSGYLQMMHRSYLIITVVVAVLGVAFMLLPQSFTVYLAPEQIILWEDSVQGNMYNFDTGEISIIEGVSPYVKVWSESNVILNTTFYTTEMNITDRVNSKDNPSEYLLPGIGTWRVQASGNIVEGNETTIYAGFYYLRLREPETITYYPYRYFGYGMTGIGVMASLVIFARSSREESR